MTLFVGYGRGSLALLASCCHGNGCNREAYQVELLSFLLVLGCEDEVDYRTVFLFGTF
jgi:hypothetical protein